ncbi:MAG: hypothetical protein K2N74_00205 [Clostridiales bacterium]|nr:hypothetical protein [Clostridiales bacterium]
MNKKLAKFCTEHGLTVTGNRAYGIMDGFETNFVYSNGWDSGAAVAAVGGGLVGASLVSSTNGSFLPVQILISFYCDDTQKMTILETLRSAGYKQFRCEFTQYGLALGFGGFTVGGIAKKLPEQINAILAVIKQNGGVGGVCPVCGKPLEEENKRTCNIEGVKITLDTDCVETINAAIAAENKEFNEAPNNYLLGFLGALIGGVVGGVLSILLYLVGFVASASAIVAAILGAFLYQKFHGKPNKMMIVIVSVTTIVCMALSVLILYIVVAGIAANAAGVDMSAFEAFSVLMQSTEPLEDSNRTFSSIFYTDLALILLFSAIGIGFTIFYLARKIKRKQSIQ